MGSSPTPGTKLALIAQKCATGNREITLSAKDKRCDQTVGTDKNWQVRLFGALFVTRPQSIRSAVLCLVVVTIAGYGQEIDPTLDVPQANKIESADPIALSRAIEGNRERVRSRAATHPDQRYQARVVPALTFTIDSLSNYCANWGFEVSRIEIMIPLESGITRTVSIGAYDLLSRNGSLRDRLTRSIGRMRTEYLEIASKLQGDDAAKYLELAHAAMPIHAVEVIGTAENINGAMKAEEPIAIIPESGTSKARSFDQTKQEYLKRNPGANWTQD